MGPPLPVWGPVSPLPLGVLRVKRGVNPLNKICGYKKVKKMFIKIFGKIWGYPSYVFLQSVK